MLEQRMYLIPFNTAGITVLDFGLFPTMTVYQADVIPLFPDPYPISEGQQQPNWKYCTGVLANGNIYLIPSHANYVSKHNPNTDTFSTIDMSAYHDYMGGSGSIVRESSSTSMSAGYALQT